MSGISRTRLLNNQEDRSMHNDFADWYRRLDIEPKDEDLQKRWKGIENFHENATGADLAEATRLFFKMPAIDPGFLDRFRESFKAADASFPMRKNDAEMQVLAAGSLVKQFENVRWSPLVSLYLLCGSAQGARTAPIPEILQMAEGSLRSRSLALRSNGNGVPISTFDLDDHYENLKDTLKSGGANFQSLHGPLTDFLGPFLKALSGLKEWAVNRSQLDQLRQEETDILWWLYGERSRDSGGHFSELKASACVVGAKELADLVRVIPGPFGSEAFLSKMLVVAGLDKASTAETISAVPAELRSQLVDHKELQAVIDLCPTHLAIQKCNEHAGKKSWLSAFQATSGFKATDKTRAINLALQTYRERMLLKVLASFRSLPNE
jgi:hypothetical protein